MLSRYRVLIGSAAALASGCRPRTDAFELEKMGIGIVGGAGALFSVLVRQPQGASLSLREAYHGISKYNAPEAQAEARQKAIDAVMAEAGPKFANILRAKVKVRLTALCD